MWSLVLMISLAFFLIIILHIILYCKYKDKYFIYTYIRGGYIVNTDHYVRFSDIYRFCC